MTLHSSTWRRPLAATTLALLCAAAPAVVAHTGTEPGHSHAVIDALTQGFVHPFTGLDHLAAMLALGAWSGLTMQRRWLAPLAFATALGLGALLAGAGLSLPAVEPMIAASLLAFGLLIVVQARWPLAVGMALAATFALFHGAAHGQEMAGALGPATLAGMVAASALLHAAGIALGTVLGTASGGRSVWLPRLAGGAVAAFGVALLLPMLNSAFA